MMTTPVPSAQATRSGLAEKLKSLIVILNETSEKMEGALIRQNVEEIWTILSEQERTAAEFEQYACLWGKFASGNRGNPEVERSIQEIDTSYARVRTRNKNNMVLIKSYLSAINKAFQKSGMKTAKSSSVYGRHGRMSRATSSLVFQKEC